MNQPVELHSADPALRRHARWLPAAVLVVGMAALWALHGWLARLPGGPAALEALLLAFLGLGVLLVAAASSLAWLLWRTAAQVLAEDRYPPRTMRTLRDVPLRDGDAARGAARMLRALAVLLALVAAGLLAWVVVTARAAG